MKRKPNKRQRQAVVNMACAGLLCVVLPFTFKQEPMHTALAKLPILGVALLVAAGGMAWLQRRMTRSASQQTSSGGPLPKFSAEPDRPKRHSPAHVLQPAVVPDAVARTAERPSPATIDHWVPEVFQAIEWRRFEAVVEALFAQAGFETKSQSHGADGGVDIWLYSKNQPGKPVSIVQCKHWAGSKVTVKPVRELRGVMASHEVQRGQFATTSTFTADAQEFAKANGINLLDVNKLLELISKRTPEQQAQLLAVATEGEYWRPTCVNCGIKLVERKGKDDSRFWGCSNFPRCRTTMVMRAV